MTSRDTRRELDRTQNAIQGLYLACAGIGLVLLLVWFLR